MLAQSFTVASGRRKASSRGCQKALEGLFARKNGQVAAGEDLLIVFGKGHLNDGVVFVLAEDDADGGIFVR